MSFDETIIHCASPALCGIKPASLFSMNSRVFSAGKERLTGWRQHFSKHKRYFVSLKKDDGRVLFFVYDQNLLKTVLSRPQNAAYLQAKGYPVEQGFQAMLAELLHRLAANTDGSFPHEVGLFLGYPLEDVVGFETEKAGNFQYAGFWKVYGDIERARRQMKRYASCSEVCMKWLEAGLSVPQSADKYTQYTEV